MGIFITKDKAVIAINPEPDYFILAPFKCGGCYHAPDHMGACNNGYHWLNPSCLPLLPEVSATTLTTGGTS